MRKILCLLSMIGLLFSLSAPVQARKKVAVVLSGGGAKGAAHIGALKVIEEAGIPVDMVVGTSMGSIIGGLYSIGYTPAQMDSIVRVQDWTYLLTDATDRKDKLLKKKQESEQYALSVPFQKKPKDALRGGIIKGRNIAQLFSRLTEGYHDSIDFKKLPIPYACVAHDLATGKEYVFHSGKLALAMRASMSIPGAFQPVHWKDMVLVDGGLSNNYPVDIAQQMGADIIIGVDVQDRFLPAHELNSLTGVVGQLVNLMVNNKNDENIKNSDVHIKVDVSDYSAASFTPAAIDTMIIRGETAARKQLDSLLLLKPQIGISDRFVPKRPLPFNIPTENEYIAIVPEINPGEEAANTLNAGIRFDNESLAALIFNTNVYLNKKRSCEAALTIRLGKERLGRVDFSFSPFNSKWDINWAYQLNYNDLDLYNNGKKICSYTFLHNLAHFNISRSWRSIRFHVGAKYEHFNFSDILLPTDFNKEFQANNEGFFIYYGQMQFDSYNKRNYPTKGMKWGINASIYTDNLVGYKDGDVMPVISASYQIAIPLLHRLTLLPWVYGRAILSKENCSTLPLMNVVGGNTAGRLLPQQLPFVGISYMQHTGSKTFVGGINLRQRMGKNQYLTFSGNFGIHSDSWKELFDNNMWGGGITYGYDSFLGPLEATLSYSDITERLGFYISWGYNF